MGIDVYLMRRQDGADAPSAEGTAVERDSAKYPAHRFSVGYFFSAYNDGGIEQVLKRARLHGLHWIFNVSNEYEVTPDWDVALARVNETIEKYSAYLVFAYRQREATDWYLQALEIVKETIEYVLAQPDRDRFYLRWSG